MLPGDLTVKQIACVFEALDQVRELALEGADEVEIGQALEWRLEDVRKGAMLQGFSVSRLVKRQELCPRCGHVLMPDGSCEVCPRRTRLERLHAINTEERRREAERLDREIDAVKQDTKRRREVLGTNPRKAARQQV